MFNINTISSELSIYHTRGCVHIKRTQFFSIEKDLAMIQLKSYKILTDLLLDLENK